MHHLVFVEQPEVPATCRKAVATYRWPIAFPETPPAMAGNSLPICFLLPGASC